MNDKVESIKRKMRASGAAAAEPAAKKPAVALSDERKLEKLDRIEKLQVR